MRIAERAFAVTTKLTHAGLGVAPFAVTDGSARTREVADGLAADITRSISLLEPDSADRLWVVEQNLIHRARLEDCDAIRRRFNVTVCLEGRLDLSSDDATLNLELLDAATGVPIASEVVETPTSNINVLQIEPAVATARLLHLQAEPGRTDRLSRLPTNVAPAKAIAPQATSLFMLTRLTDAARGWRVIEATVRILFCKTSLIIVRGQVLAAGDEHQSALDRLAVRVVATG